EASPPSPEEALGRAGVGGGDEHELFQFLVEGRKLVRVKESLYFHAAALDAIQDKVVALLRERKEIGPGDIKDLLGISRKYAIPLLEYLDARRVTVRMEIGRASCRERAAIEEVGAARVRHSRCSIA